MHPQRCNVTCNEPRDELGANKWGDQDSGQDSHSKNTSPRRCFTPTQALVSVQNSWHETISLMNCSNVRLQESIDTDWKPYRRADTLMYHLTQHIPFTTQHLREQLSHLMSRKVSCHKNAWWISETSSFLRYRGASRGCS